MGVVSRVTVYEKGACMYEGRWDMISFSRDLFYIIYFGYLVPLPPFFPPVSCTVRSTHAWDEGIGN